MKTVAVGHLLQQLLQDHQFKALKLPSICSRLPRLKKILAVRGTSGGKTEVTGMAYAAISFDRQVDSHPIPGRGHVCPDLCSRISSCRAFLHLLPKK